MRGKLFMSRISAPHKDRVTPATLALYEPAMPAKHTLHVALTEPLVRHVRGKVQEGAYPSASDVVRLALEAMIRREEDGGQPASTTSQNMERCIRG